MGGARSQFQPVVDLSSGAVVGFEALVRGPDASPLSSPDALLAAAHRTGQLVEFDWVARASACRAALAAGLGSDLLLFLNIEPIALDSDCPTDLWPDIERAFRTLRVVLEVTERSLDRDPGTLLDGIERQRPLVAGIALDDVGSDPATLAMLSLVAPSIIKLDRSVTQATPGDAVAQVLYAVHEQAGRTGAVVLAEGVQTAGWRDQARAYGAGLGQGFLLGAPGPLAGPDPHAGAPFEVRNSPPLIIDTPFDGPAAGPAGANLLRALTRHVAACADASAPTLHIALLPTADLLTSTELDRLARLARQGTFCAVLGPGIPPEPGHGIRGVGMRRAGQPPAEWAAITIGPCSNAAVLAGPAARSATTTLPV